MSKKRTRKRNSNRLAQNRPLERQAAEDRHIAGERTAAINEIGMTRRQVAIAAYSHSGPIPDPMMLEKYEQVLPGCADRILTMAENQSSHRRELEMRAVKSRSRDSLLGIVSGFLLALLTILAGTYIINIGQIWSGTIIGSAGLVGLVSVFVYGTRSNRKEREEKNKHS